MAVARTERLSTSILRITLGGDTLEYIGTEGLDQRVKVVLPLPHTGFGDYGLLDDTGEGMTHWYARWRQLPDADRNPLRTYTVRNPRPEAREVDIDFVLHGDAGPASAWATSAAVGDEVVVVGPDSRADDRSGIEWNPGSATRVLLAGDETALPAISAILESLPADIRGHAFIEVPHADDALAVTTASDVSQTWLVRDGAPLGEKLDAAVRDWAATNLTVDAGAEPESVEIDEDMLWEVPEQAADAAASDLYAWLAGEAGVITTLRRHLVREVGLDRRQVAFMGYWRIGRAEG